MRTHSLHGALGLVLGTLAIGLAACGNTLQDQPIGSSQLEQLIMVRPFPVYWLGRSFHGLAVSGVTEDPSGAYEIQYGDCSIGGQQTCVAPLTLITNPDNSFQPGGASPRRTILLRGVRATLTRSGQTLEVPTGVVVVDIDAASSTLARQAGQSMTPINRIALPGERLPAPAPNSGFAAKPLLTQVPSTPPPPELGASLGR